MWKPLSDSNKNQSIDTSPKMALNKESTMYSLEDVSIAHDSRVGVYILTIGIVLTLLLKADIV